MVDIITKKENNILHTKVLINNDLIEIHLITFINYDLLHNLILYIYILFFSSSYHYSATQINDIIKKF